MAWTLSAFADEAGPTCDEQIAALQRAGLKRVDIRGIERCNISVLPLDKAQEIRKKFDAAGITVGMFGSPLGKIDLADDFKIDIDKLTHMGKLAPILGCKQVRIFSYYNKKKNAPLDVHEKESLDRMLKLRDLAEKLDLVLYHENEGGIYGETLDRVLKISAKLRNHSAAKPGSFRLIFDFDNYNHADQDVWQAWEALRDKTDAFHLKDSGKDKLHVPLGQGNGQVKKILTDALARKWSGPLSLEPHLTHSQAVLVTNVGSAANQKYADLPLPETFHLAAEAAKNLLGSINAQVS